MPETTTLITFSLIALGMVLTPGPNMIYLISRSICQGPVAGLISLGGVALGFVVYMLCAAFGITAFVMAVPYAYDALRAAGAAYLLYLAWGAWNAPASVPDESGSAPALPAMTPMQAWLRGVIMNLTNPKVILFFLAFLPQFSSPARGSVAVQTFLLGLIFIVAAGLTFSVLALLAGGIGQKLQHSAKALRWLNRSARVVFVGLAAKLLVSQR